MMDLTTWLAFAAASLVIALIPGPGVATIVGYAMHGGRRVALSAVAGAALGNLFAATLSMAGAGAVLAQSALAFTVLKWIGAGYLVAIGLYAIATSGRVSATAVPRGMSARMAMWGTCAVTALHPKTIVFFLAFAPQFIALDRDYGLQSAILVVTFAAVLAASDLVYALSASAAASALRKPAVRRWTQRAGGGVLVAAGAATAMSRS